MEYSGTRKLFVWKETGEVASEKVEIVPNVPSTAKDQLDNLEHVIREMEEAETGARVLFYNALIYALTTPYTLFGVQVWLQVFRGDAAAELGRMETAGDICTYEEMKAGVLRQLGDDATKLIGRICTTRDNGIKGD